MLKVMKYDWKNGWNSVRPVLLLATVLSILLGLVLGMGGGQVTVYNDSFGIMSDSDALPKGGALLGIVWFAVMVALLVLTLDAIFKNMSGRMFGPEGYLTHALPVHTWELLLGKTLGTWIFGVFMVAVAIASILLMMLSAMAGSGSILKTLTFIVDSMPKLGAYHFQQLARGAGYVLYGVAAFLAGSFLLVVQFQFICIAARQFGKFHAAGGIIVFWILCSIEGNLNHALSMGFLIVLVSSAACFYGSWWLLNNRLSV